MRQESDEKNSKREKAIEGNVWKATSLISFITIALLAASIIVSFFVHYTVPVVIIFILAVGAFVFNTIKVKKEEKEEKERAEDDIDAETKKTDDEIHDYEINYIIKQREALNKKLASLGFQPATADDF